MAATVTALLTELSDADTTTGWSGNSGGQDVYSYIEGGATPASYTWYLPKNNVITCTFTPATNQNFTTNYTYPHLYFWMQTSIAQFLETRAADGFKVRLTDGTGNWTEWTMAGNDTWRGEWKCFILDTANTSDITATSGTLSLTDIDIIGFTVDSQNIGYRNVDNMWNDLLQFGEGLKATGTAFDFGDIATIDSTLANQYGILQATNGVLFCQGKLQIGDGATTTTFSSSGEQIVFIDPTTSGVGGGAVGSVNPNLYQLIATGSGCDFDVAGSFIAAAGSQDYLLDIQSTVNSFDISGCTFVKANQVNLQNITSSLCSGNTFDQCGEIDVNGAVFENNTINNTTETTTGAVVVNATTDLNNAKNITFNSFGTNYAIYVVAAVTSISLDNFQFDNPNGTGGNYALYWAGTSGTLTVSASNGTNLVTAGCTAASGGTVSVTSSIQITITVKDSAGNAIVGARVGIFKTSDRTQIMNEDTIAGGIATESYSGGATEVVVRVREASGGTKYNSFSSVQNLTTSNFNLDVTLTEDIIA